MFVLCRDYLKTTAQAVGIDHVLFKPQTAGGGRRCTIYTRPGFRSTLEFTRDHQDRKVKRWQDWNDTNVRGYPKKKSRQLSAKRSLSFIVVLDNNTDILMETDFINFINALDKYIYDGTTANYINELGENKSDTKGNKIDVILGGYDFNDNGYYGDLLSKAVLNIEFRGAVYRADSVDSEIVVPGTYAKPEVNNVTT